MLAGYAVLCAGEGEEPEPVVAASTNPAEGTIQHKNLRKRRGLLMTSL
jgi:hypothetical protein